MVANERAFGASTPDTAFRHATQVSFRAYMTTSTLRPHAGVADPSGLREVLRSARNCHVIRRHL